MERVSDAELAEYAPGGDDAGLMAREIRAYRESGALEALRAAKTEIQASGNWTARDFGWPDVRKKIDASIAQLEAIESGAVDESKGMKN